MNKLMLFVVLATAACGDSNHNNTTPPPVDAAQQSDAAGLQCFSGTPTSNDQLMNACVDQTVTVIHKAPVLPLLNSDGSLPPLP